MLQLAKRPAMTRASQAFNDVELYLKRGNMVTTLPLPKHQIWVNGILVL